MCVLDTKKLVISYWFNLWETSLECPKNVQKRDTGGVTSLGRPQDVKLIIIYKIGF